MPLLTLNMKESLCCCLLCDRVVHPHSLYKFSDETDLVNPLTSWAASYASFVMFVSSVQNTHPIQLMHIHQLVAETNC